MDSTFQKEFLKLSHSRRRGFRTEIKNSIEMKVISIIPYRQSVHGLIPFESELIPVIDIRSPMDAGDSRHFFQSIILIVDFSLNSLNLRLGIVVEIEETMNTDMGRDTTDLDADSDLVIGIVRIGACIQFLIDKYACTERRSLRKRGVEWRKLN